MANDIQEKYRESLKELGQILDSGLNPNGIRETGFVILIFGFGDGPDTNHTNYLSNCVREDAIKAMQELIANMELEGKNKEELI